MVIITLNVIDTSCPYATGKTFINMFNNIDSSYDVNDITEDITKYIDFLGDKCSK